MMSPSTRLTKFAPVKVVIFAGGKGTRLSEESELRPKPMIEIGGYPILWHIMKMYSAQGFNEFVICLGYKGYQIKEYFINYFMHHSDISIDLKENQTKVHSSHSENFKVSLVNTGEDTLTAGRLKRVQEYVGDQDFMLTYGDGLADIDLKELLKYHNEQAKICTMTAIQSGSRFGIMDLDESNLVQQFIEKPKDDGTWINGGFFVIKPGVFRYLKDDADSTMWEDQPLEDLSKDSELVAYKHRGFWKCMDTIRDLNEMKLLWAGDPRWKQW